MKSGFAKGCLFLIVFVSFAHITLAQVLYNSSTGADGALDLSSGSKEVQLPESGILNYTTVNIPVNNTLTFRRNSKNTPVIILVQGKVTIAGSISVSASGNTPGPGGFYGAGGPNQSGFGPGGGSACSPGCLPESFGKWVGPLSLVPIIGGSGGGGISTTIYPYTGLGGGGGGAIVIATSSSIEVAPSAAIYANGGNVGNTYGSGGAIRLVANSIDASGYLSAQSSGSGIGMIRLEAQPNGVKITGNNFPGPAPIISTINPVIIPAINPILTITTIAGFPVPQYSGQRFNTVDVMLPKQLPDLIPIVVQANNIPVGSQVKVTISGSPEGTSTTSTLSGSFPFSTATVNVSKLVRDLGTITYLFVSATFDLPQVAQNFNPPGRDQIAQVRIESPLGAKSKYIFLRRDGTEIPTQRIPQALLQQFGQ